MNWKLVSALCISAVILACGGNSADPASANSSATTAAQPQRSGEKINWVSYTDTAEGAFSMDVPVGWEVQGGMYRFGYFDVRWMMDARSLDGKIILRINDVNVPPYSLPSPGSSREGQPYSKPQQFQMIVSRYHDGQAYAEMYAKHRFANVCKSMNPRTADWKPSASSNPEWSDDAGTHSTDGNVSYDCDTSDGPRIASVFVHSTLYPQGGFWMAMPISVLSAPERATFAHSMVDHMIGTWKKNPQWVQHQNQMTQAGLDMIRGQFRDFMSQMQAYHQQRTAAMNQQVAGYYSRMNAQSQQVSDWGKLLTGVADYTDPATGNQFQVFTGPKANQYINGTGVIVNSNVSPGPGFHEMTPVQHQ